MYGSGFSISPTVRTLALTALIAAAAIAVVLMPSSAKAAENGLCVNTAGAPAVIFGPNSWFRPSDVQGSTSFSENGPQTVATYPLYRGTSHRRPVEYVITDASDLKVARELGVMYAPKLAAANGTAAVQDSDSRIVNGNGIRFPATVDFSGSRTLTPNSSTGFPPVAATPGPVGDTGYSPFVEVSFRGHKVVLNAPQLANWTGQHPKLASQITDQSKTASMKETFGCFDDLSVHYVSFDGSAQGVSAIENVTYAPALKSAPSAGCADSTIPTDQAGPSDRSRLGRDKDDAQRCARESLVAFTNGPTPISNNQWQGLNNSLLDLAQTGVQISPFNLFKGVPDPTQRFEYSPLWDAHLTTWTAPAVAGGIPVRVGNFQDVVQEAALGYVTAPGGTPWGASGFVVNCPPVSLNVPEGDVPTG